MIYQLHAQFNGEYNQKRQISLFERTIHRGIFTDKVKGSDAHHNRVDDDEYNDAQLDMMIVDNVAAYDSQVVKFSEDGIVGNARVEVVAVAVGGMDGGIHFAGALFRRRCFVVTEDWHRLFSFGFVSFLVTPNTSYPYTYIILPTFRGFSYQLALQVKLSITVNIIIIYNNIILISR